MRSWPKIVFLLLIIFILIGVGVGLWIFFKPIEKKNKSGLQIITDDKIVSIFINDEFLGKSPFLTKDLKPGEYNIRLEPENDNLIPYESTVNLRTGLLTVITWKPGVDLNHSGGVIYELEKLKNRRQTELSIVSIPDAAIISIDEGEKEFAPVIKQNLTEGNHDFSVSLPSYETQQHSINIVKGHRLNVLVKLAKAEIANDIVGVQNPEPPIEASPSATPQPVRQPAAEISLLGDKVLIKKTNYFENNKEVLKIRSASTSASAVIGLAEVGLEYPYLEEKTKDWIKIKFNQQNGWVSSDYAEIID